MSNRSLRPAGALATLAIGFVASAGLRAGDVVAALPERGGDGFGNPLPMVMTDTMKADEPSATGDGDVMVLVAELREQRRALDARAAKLADRAQMIEALEQRLEDRLQELEDAQRRLEETAVLVDDAAGKDVRHLAEMYQQMKPKQAAEIFNQMPPSFAAGFLSEMQSNSAALIMANMEADRAYAVSILLAGRNVGRAPVSPR
ncbi:MAG: hypothetical protein AAFU49_03530 [Pseudomonadota bacterium]